LSGLSGGEEPGVVREPLPPPIGDRALMHQVRRLRPAAVEELDVEAPASEPSELSAAGLLAHVVVLAANDHPPGGIVVVASASRPPRLVGVARREQFGDLLGRDLAHAAPPNRWLARAVLNSSSVAGRIVGWRSASQSAAASVRNSSAASSASSSPAGRSEPGQMGARSPS